MAHGRSKELWDHTCSLVVTLVNCWSESKIQVEDIHPYAPKQQVEYLSPKESMAYLKRIYGRQ